MKFTLSKLNASGIAHFILPLVVVIGVAVVGTYLLVASHAQVPPSDRVTGSKVDI